ncbi:MAG TPA: HAD-IA family hydrolase [Acidimicrobiia bacterium]|nr:HAD-IA family hydrolase [Acidimicrobiia bacterium]
MSDASPAGATGPIEAVIFDYGGVISARFLRDLHVFEDEMGYPRGSVEELMFGPSAADGGDTVHDFHRLERGELALVDYLQGLERRAPDVLGRPLDLEAYRAFAGASAVAVHWPVVHCIRRLLDLPLRLALLTNNVREFGNAWRATFPVDELFAVVVDSSAVGMRKPDPAIYTHTCEVLGVAASAAVFLDDNRDNIDAAAALGLETVHVGVDPIVAIEELDAILERRGVSFR